MGVVEVREMKDGKQQQTQYEVDFIAMNGQEKYYIQSAYRIDDDVKREQELQRMQQNAMGGAPMGGGFPGM